MFLTTTRGSVFPQTRDFTKLLDEVFDNSFNSFKTDKYPATDIYTEDGVTHIEVAVTGFSKDDIEVSIDKGVLTITGDRLTTEEDTDETMERNYHYRSIAKRNFTRSFQLADDIEDAKVSLDNGLLHVELITAPEIDTKKVLEII